MALTATEIIEALNNANIEGSEFYEGEGGGMSGGTNDEDEPVFGWLGKAPCVDEDENEGDGHIIWRVRHFVDHDVYIKVTGWYSSYADNTFESDALEQVRPVKKYQTTFVDMKSKVVDDIAPAAKSNKRPVQVALISFLATKDMDTQFTVAGKKMSVRDIISEVENDTPVGRDFETAIVKQTLERLGVSMVIST